MPGDMHAATVCMYTPLIVFYAAFGNCEAFRLAWKLVGGNLNDAPAS